MDQVFTLVYTSQASVEFKDGSLEEIYAISRRNNLNSQITGFLTYRQGYFLQFLEGPKEEVLNCFKRIQKDSRHTSIIKHGEALSNKRLFPDWAMGEVTNLNGLTSSDNLIDLFELAKNGTPYQDVQSLMSIFNLFSKEVKVI